MIPEIELPAVDALRCEATPRTLDDILDVAASGKSRFRVTFLLDRNGRIAPTVLLADNKREIIVEVPIEDLERFGLTKVGACTQARRIQAMLATFRAEQLGFRGAA